MNAAAGSPAVVAESVQLEAELAVVVASVVAGVVIREQERLW